jgi:hypothetical protein
MDARQPFAHDATPRGPERANPARARWVRVAYDLAGVDEDIERALALLQARHGYARNLASVELIRRLSLSAS